MTVRLVAWLVRSQLKTHPLLISTGLARGVRLCLERWFHASGFLLRVTNPNDPPKIVRSDHARHSPPLP
jgi:hypothetical protein